jgi:hypothetical protein
LAVDRDSSNFATEQPEAEDAIATPAIPGNAGAHSENATPPRLVTTTSMQISFQFRKRFVFSLWAEDGTSLSFIAIGKTPV